MQSTYEIKKIRSNGICQHNPRVLIVKSYTMWYMHKNIIHMLYDAAFDQFS